MTEKPLIPKPRQQGPETRREIGASPTQNAIPQATPLENTTISRVMYLQSVAGNRATQRLSGGKSVQRAVNVRLLGQMDTRSYNDLDTLCEAAGVAKKDILIPMKTKLFEGGLFPEQYKNSLLKNQTLQVELKSIIYDLDDLIAGANSQSVIVLEKGKAGDLAKQLYAIISPGITPIRLNGYAYYRKAATLGGDKGGDYLRFLDLFLEKLPEYEKKLDTKDNKRFQHRIDAFKEKADLLKDEIEGALTRGDGTDVTDPIMQKIKAFTVEINQFELAWDLDFQEGEDDLETTVEDNLANNEALGDKYKIGGGTDDNEDVGDEYRSLLACSLYAILTVKPGWLGAETPEDLHKILRKTGQLKAYDDDRVAAKIRYLAGLTPTMIGGQNKTVKVFLEGEASKKVKKNYIIDAEGIAHTFAAKWDGEKYVKVDEQTPAGGAFGKFENKKALTAWN